MKTCRLGRTQIAVTELCLGTMTWGLQNTQAEAHAQLDYALDHGVTFIDTAEVYAVPPSAETYGKTETYIGNWFRSTGKRDKWVLASKVAGGGQAWVRGGRRSDGASIREAVEASLRRLQTDYIDLYQIHWPWRGHYHFDGSWVYRPERQDTVEVLAAMLDSIETLSALVREGKIRHYGLSNETAWGVTQFARLAAQHGHPAVASIQNEYNLLRRLFDHDLAEVSHHEGVGLLAYSPLAAGALTGKYLGGIMPPGSRGAVSGGLWRNNRYSEPAIRAYLDLAGKHGLDVAQMAIAFCLTRPFMTSVIIGGTSVEQLATDIAAADLVLSPEVLAEIDAVFRQFPRPI